MGLLDDFNDQELLSRAGCEDIAAGIAASLAGRRVLLTWHKRLAEHLSDVRLTEGIVIGGQLDSGGRMLLTVHECGADPNDPELLMGFFQWRDIKAIEVLDSIATDVDLVEQATTASRWIGHEALLTVPGVEAQVHADIGGFGVVGTTAVVYCGPDAASRDEGQFPIPFDRIGNVELFPQAQ